MNEISLYVAAVAVSTLTPGTNLAKLSYAGTVPGDWQSIEQKIVEKCHAPWLCLLKICSQGFGIAIPLIRSGAPKACECVCNKPRLGGKLVVSIICVILSLTRLYCRLVL